MGLSGCRSWWRVGITACHKQTTPGSGNRESAGLALCRDSYIQLFQVLITTAAAAPPRKASWGCTSSFPRARWAAPTKSIKVCGTSSRIKQAPWACKTGTGLVQRPPEQPRGSSTKAEPLQPGSETHSSQRRKPWSEQRDKGGMGHKRGQTEATLLCRLHNCLFTPHCPQEDTGLVGTGTVQVPGR